MVDEQHLMLWSVFVAAGCHVFMMMKELQSGSLMCF